MKKLVLLAALTTAVSFGFESNAYAHGGQYRGPGDTVPPGGGGSGGGAPGSPGPSGPSTPGSSSPSSPGAGAPGAPGGGPASPTSGGGLDSGTDLSQWTFWWEFNKEPYLNLKAAIHGGATKTGSEGFFLGHGAKEQGKDSLAPSEAQIRQTIVPALLKALETETNNDIVTGCLVALAKIGDAESESGESEFEKVIAKRLSDPVQEISETAAVALGILANDASVARLKDLLMDTPRGREYVGGVEVNQRTRSFAAYGLSLIGARTGEESVRQDIVRILIDAIANDTTNSRDLKVACIVSLGMVPLSTIEPSVPEGAETPDPATGRLGQLEYLFDYLQNEDNRYLVRAHAPTALARLVQGLPEELYTEWKEKLAEDFMGRISKRSKEKLEVQQSAILALGLIGDHDDDSIDQKIRKALANVPKELSNQQTRNFSMIALAKACGNVGNGNEEGVQFGVKALSQQLAKGASSLKPWAGLAMGVMGRLLSDHEVATASTTALATALRAGLSDEKNPRRVGAYAIGLGILGDPEATSILLDKLERISDDEARGYISVGLGLMGARTAIEPIQKLIEESKYRPELLKQAAVSLGLLGDKELVGKLTDMLAEAKSLATQAAISSALGFIGDRRSIDPLVEMLQNQDLTDRARGFAAVALGIVADKEELPWNSKIAVDLNYRASTETLNDQQGTGILNIL